MYIQVADPVIHPLYGCFCCRPRHAIPDRQNYSIDRSYWAGTAALSSFGIIISLAFWGVSLGISGGCFCGAIIGWADHDRLRPDPANCAPSRFFCRREGLAETMSRQHKTD